MLKYLRLYTVEINLGVSTLLSQNLFKRTNHVKHDKHAYVCRSLTSFSMLCIQRHYTYIPKIYLIKKTKDKTYI